MKSDDLVNFEDIVKISEHVKLPVLVKTEEEEKWTVGVNDGVASKGLDGVKANELVKIEDIVKTCEIVKSLVSVNTWVGENSGVGLNVADDSLFIG